MSHDLRVSIKYSGKSVNEGSMDLDHTISALSGFSTAYKKVAFAKRVDATHEIRISGINKGSVDFKLQVATYLATNKDVIIAAGGALAIIKTIFEIVKLTKHAEGADSKAKADANGNIIITNSKNVSINIARDTYQLYQDGAIRQDLHKLADPLDKGKIDRLSISAKDKNKSASEGIDSSEKAFFGYIPKEVVETKEMVLEGRLFSLNTEINRGSLRLPNGERVGYRFKTDHPEKFYAHVLRKGLVRVKCIAHLDENLKPVHIDITDIEALDQDLPFK